jgi:hypothetical protein
MDGRTARGVRGGAAGIVAVVLASALISACSSSTQASPDGGGGDVTGSSLIGRIYPPGLEQGVPWFVRIATDPSTVANPVAQQTGKTAGTMIDYEVHGIPDGSFYVLILIDVDGSGGSAPTLGDYYSWCNPTDDGNPPAAPNVFAYNNGTTRNDCHLIVR